MRVLVQAFAPDSILGTLIFVHWEFAALLLACANTFHLCFAEDSTAMHSGSATHACRHSRLFLARHHQLLMLH